MGDQIEALELRMERREKELISEIEQAKAAAAIERSRLEALHAQVTAARSVLNWLCLCG
jgi:outer membrane protein TolC